MKAQDGGIAVHILGTALLCMVLLGGMGLAEAARAGAIRAAAAGALAAAVRSAATRETDQEAQAAFREVLAANLGYSLGISTPGALGVSPIDAPYQAYLRFLPAGSPDPVTGQPVPRSAVAGRLRFRYRLRYLGTWLPAIPVELHHIELAAPDRKGRF